MCGDIGSGRRANPELGFDDYVLQLDAVLDTLGLRRAAICGVSFGGFIAVRYAAVRPERVTALVLASAPGPGFRPNAQQARWLSKPWLSTPAFVVTSPLRVWPEIRTAIPRWSGRFGFLARQAWRCAGAPLIPSLMASRVRCASVIDFEIECRAVVASTLVLTGEEGLDRVVPVPSTRRYASLIPGAQYRVIPGTGHLGLLTQPATFAEIVSGFVHGHHY